MKLKKGDDGCSMDSGNDDSFEETITDPIDTQKNTN